LIGWIATALILVLMRVTRKYFIPSIIFTILGVTLCCFTLLSIPNEYHLVDNFWMIIITLYAYFTLGKTWGNIALFVNICTVVVYIYFQLNNSIRTVPELSHGAIISLSLNVAMCGLVIGYLIYQFLKTTR